MNLIRGSDKKMFPLINFSFLTTSETQVVIVLTLLILHFSGLYETS